jgi:hypothetical protein
MRSLASLFVLFVLAGAPAAASAAFHYHVAGDDPGSWPAILSSVGLVPGAAGTSGVFVIRTGPATLASQWRERVANGSFLILEGESEIAAAFGFRAGGRRVQVRNVVDARDASLDIIWEKRLELPVFDIPSEARVFAAERWTDAPLVAGMRCGEGAVLWVAVSPGIAGYERFPYLLQALGDLGFQTPFRATRFWAFFDSSYRARVDLEYFAKRWRASGISTLHVAAWHYFEPDPDRDAYLRHLIAACHQEAILVYAWLELPHVSETFWRDHPEWREKTAILQDAHLDWRKLMNLANRDCFREVARGVHRLMDRFDWDGVNLAELYFESLEGADNPARFTPMNHDVRREFAQIQGFDPLELFQSSSPRRLEADPVALRKYLDYRAALARRMQEEWIGELERVRLRKNHLDLVLTHVDDRMDSRMRDFIGADAAALLPLLERRDFTFLVEDPATLWDLGPGRYTEIASRYRRLTRRPEKLSIDINIVERYQDVYPTEQQTGIELYQQVRAAAAAFPRVALYAEHSIQRHDIAFLPSALAAVSRVEQIGGKLVVETAHGVGIPWRGGALVNGRLWPAHTDELLWLPAGAHAIQPASRGSDVRLLDLNGELEAAFAGQNGIEFAYRSSARAIAVLDRKPTEVQVDGAEFSGEVLPVDGRHVLLLPRGQHLVFVRAAALAAD